MSAKPSVLLIDDHPVALTGLRLVLGKHAGFRICGEASDARTARRLVEELRPEFIVMDLRLGGRDGVELVEDLHLLHPEAQILIFSSLDEMCYAKRTLRAGARGFVMKDRDLEDVRTALEQLACGAHAFSPTVQRALFDEVAGRGAGDPIEELSDRELQIFRLLGEGRSTAEIAEDLYLSMKTVGTYRERLKEKLKLKTARELEESARVHVSGKHDGRPSRRT